MQSTTRPRVRRSAPFYLTLTGATLAALAATFELGVGARPVCGANVKLAPTAKTAKTVKPATSAKSSKSAKTAPLAPIAPFVDGKTLLIARLDVENIDLDRFGETLDGVFAQTLKNAGFIDSAVADSQAEFAKTIDALKGGARLEIDAFLTSTGLKSAYFVLQSTKAETCGAALIIPLDGATKERRDAAKSFVVSALKRVGLDWNCAVYKDAWLVAAPDLKAFGAFYKSFKPGPASKEAETFFAETAETNVFQLYCARFKIRQAIAEAGFDPKAVLAAGPRSIKEAVEIFDVNFVDLRAAVDLVGLKGRVDVRFNSGDDAGKARAALGKLVDETIKAQFGKTINVANDSFNLATLARETARGSYRARLPRREGESLVSEFDLGSDVAELSKLGSIAGVGIVVGILVPAAQAAREAARRAPARPGVFPIAVLFAAPLASRDGKVVALSDYRIASSKAVEPAPAEEEEAPPATDAADKAEPAKDEKEKDAKKDDKSEKSTEPATKPDAPKDAASADKPDAKPEPAKDAASTEPPKNLKKAGVGATGKGEYGVTSEQAASIITVPISAYFKVQEKAVFNIQIPQALSLFNGSEGRYPNSQEEFMTKIIAANSIVLPKLPDGDEYVYDVPTHTLMIATKDAGGDKK